MDHNMDLNNNDDLYTLQNLNKKRSQWFFYYIF